MNQLWAIASGSLRDVVVAPDQWAAWDTWRGEDALAFGLIATAEPSENGDPIPVKTSTLMERWGRPFDAKAFHDLAASKGLE